MKKIRFSKKPTAPKNSWEANFGKILTPFEEFVHGEINSGILLIICTVIALFLANSSFIDLYHHFLETYFTIGTDKYALKMSIHHWINDGLMALFFFLVGLEIKREVLVGELSVFRQAMLPVFAAIGGMVVPALFYYVFNMSDPSAAKGWGIPMATDIAFAVTALVLLGNRIPKPLITFLVALAIVDDMGGVLVIAIFYTESINMNAIFSSLVICATLFAVNLGGVRKTWVYAILGVLLWVFMYKSGIHATVAGILTALIVPARSRYKPKMFNHNARILLDRFEVYCDKESDVLSGSKMNGVLQALETGINKAQTPLQNMEHAQHIPVNFLIIPLFALANAGIPIDMGSITGLFSNSVTLGVILGLVIGKPIGITLFSWMAIKLGICSLPTGVTIKHIMGAGMLAGIGFTMSIFIAELAFKGNADILVLAKTGILFASILSAIIGLLYLMSLNKKKEGVKI